MSRVRDQLMVLARRLTETLSPRPFSLPRLQALAKKYGAELKRADSFYELRLPWKQDEKVVTMITFDTSGSELQFLSLVIFGLDRLGVRDAELKSFVPYLQGVEAYLNVVKSLVLEILLEDTK